MARDILRSGVLEYLRRAGCLITLGVPHDKYSFYRLEFSAPGVEIRVAPDLAPSSSERRFLFVARNALATRTIRMLQKTEAHLSRRYGLFFLKRLLWLCFGWSGIFQRLTRSWYRSMAPQRECASLLEDIKPDVVFITDAFGDRDVALWRAAARLGIRTAVMIRSWDNLTNHGILRLAPDRLIVHSPFIKNLAMQLHRVPEKSIVMTGLPQYDWYVQKDLFKTREDFCRGIGADPDKKLILFAGIGDFLASHEWEVAKIMSEDLEAGKIAGPATILFRPHPNFLSQRERIRFLKHTIFDDHVAQYTGSDKSTMEMGKEEVAHLVNSLLHADVVVTTASTITIDAVAFDKPVVCIGFDGESREPYWNSVRRFYRDFTHYRLITQTKGFKLAHSREELAGAINKYLRDPSLDRDGRKKIFDEFIWRLDGGSAQRVADAVIGAERSQHIPHLPELFREGAG